MQVHALAWKKFNFNYLLLLSLYYRYYYYYLELEEELVIHSLGSMVGLQVFN